MLFILFAAEEQSEVFIGKIKNNLSFNDFFQIYVGAYRKGAKDNDDGCWAVSHQPSVKGKNGSKCDNRVLNLSMAVKIWLHIVDLLYINLSLWLYFNPKCQAEKWKKYFYVFFSLFPSIKFSFLIKLKLWKFLSSGVFFSFFLPVLDWKTSFHSLTQCGFSRFSKVENFSIYRACV